MNTQKALQTQEFTQFELTKDLLLNLAKFDITATSKLVALYLTSCYNPEKATIYPKIITISEILGLSEKAVRLAIAELIEKGLILKSKISHTNKNQYVFTSNVTDLTGKNCQSKQVKNTDNQKVNFTTPIHEQTKKEQKTSTNRQKNVVAFTKNFKNKREIISLEDVPEIIRLKAKTNPCGYWASIPESERKRIWQEQKKLDEKRAKTQAKLELKRKMEAQEQLKIEKEYSEHPKFEDYTRLQALAFCSKFVTFGKGKALKFQQVKEFTTKHNITWTEIVEYKEKTKLEKCCNFQNDMI